MMEIVECDACRKQKRKDDTWQIKISGMYAEDGAFDLCEKCKNKLSELLKW